MRASIDVVHASPGCKHIAEAELEVLRCRTALGYALDRKYLRTWQIKDVEERLQCWRAALQHEFPYALPTDGVPTKLELLLKVSEALRDYYLHSYQTDDLHELVFLARSGLSTLPSDSTTKQAFTLLYAVALRIRFERLGDPDDLDSAVSLIEQCLAKDMPESCSNHHLVLTEMGIAYWRIFEQGGDGDYLDKALALQEDALRVCPKQSEALSYTQHNLAAVLLQCYKAKNTKADLERSFCIAQAVLDLRPPGHRERHASLQLVASGYQTLYRLSKDRKMLSSAIQFAFEALELRPVGHAQRSETLTQLGGAHLLQAVKTAATADFDASIALCQESVDLLPPKPTPLSRHDIPLNNLGVCLTARYNRLGELSDLERATRIQRLAMDLRPVGHPMRWSSLVNLGEALINKYEHTQQDKDFEEADALLREGLEICPLGSRGHAQLVCMLAMGHDMQYALTGNYDAAEELVNRLQAVLDHDGPASPLYTGCLALLTQALTLHHVVHGNPASLERAIMTGRELLSRDDEFSTRIPQIVALCLYARFQDKGQVEDAEEALRLLYRALDAFEENNPWRAVCHSDLAQNYMLQAAPHFDLTKALWHIDICLRDETHNPQSTLLHGLRFLQTLEGLSAYILPTHMDVLSGVYARSIELLYKVAHFGLDEQSRLSILKRADSLPEVAALHTILQSRYGDAVEILETGRAVFWQQYLRLRPPIDDLPPNVAQRMVGLLALLDQSKSNSPAPHSHGMSIIPSPAQNEALLARRRQAGRQIEELLLEIRQVPGLERFLLNDTYQDLRMAAVNGPVVVFVPGREDSHVLIVRNAMAEAEHICLEGVGEDALMKWRLVSTRDRVARRNTTQTRAMRQITKYSTQQESVLSLWNKIMAPIVHALRVPKASGRKRQRIFICATGAFSQLPLHAAGGAEGCMTDYLVASYIPTVGALLHAQRLYSPVKSSDAKLLVALTATLSHGSWRPLPAAQYEVNLIGHLLGPDDMLGVDSSPARSTSKLSSRVPQSAQSVLKHLPNASILHLACHAYQDVHSPLESGFVMQDGLLKMSQLIDLRLDHAFLAFLSACETAKGDATQPNQVIDLASAMFFAGFKSVVGTMWSMGDIDGPIVAGTIYEQLFATNSEYLNPDVIPYALDDAIQALRAENLHPNRWAPYVHVGI